MSVRISAVVCTHNRAAYLRKALRSLVCQTLARELYEVVVVDNASADSTREVVAEFGDVSNLRYLYEPIVGHSRARNAGWRGAKGEYVAYLDDDAVASPEWLEKLVEVFETFEPSPGCVGGKIEAIWEAPRPDWLGDEMLGRLSIFDWSDVPVVVTKDQWLSGCNLALPRELLQAAGGFREDLGRQGTNLRGNDDIDMRQRLDSLGRCTVYHPGIVVGHHASPERLTKKWFRRAAYWQGMSDAIMQYPDSGEGLSLSRRMRLTLRKIGWALPRLLLMLIATTPAGRFRRECQLLEAIGFVSGLWARGSSISACGDEPG
jgi:glycosyltransferase involved in cell wall biosynthesis